MTLKIKIDPLDRLFSEYIRKLSKGYCERCGAYYGWQRLQCCHFHTRGEKAIRWDEDNACACDFGCHQYLDSHPLEKVEFFQKRLGKRFDLLNARRRTMGRPDKSALTLYFKTKIKELP